MRLYVLITPLALAGSLVPPLWTLAAAVLGDANAVRFVPLTTSQRFDALRAGFGRVHVDAIGAGIDLRGADLDEFNQARLEACGDHRFQPTAFLFHLPSPSF